MSRMRILGAVIAALAFSALAVANASATKFLNNGEEVKTETTTSTHWTLFFHHTDLLGHKILIKCTGLLHLGVGPSSLLGKVNLVLGLLAAEQDLLSCEVTEDTNHLCVKAVGELVLLHPIHLPWHTLLELIGGETVDHFLNEAGKAPGSEALCPVLGKVSCEGLELAKFIGNGANGAKFEFTGTTKSEKCSDGGTGTILGVLEFLVVTVS